MDTDLEILIRAIADEKSADEATKQLVNRVFAKLKDDAITLPINSKLDKSELKKLDDNVKQARKEVVRRYNKLQKEMANPEGFDAFSDKAINELIELGKAYATFNSKASGRSKNSLKAVTDVKAALGDVFQLYENSIKLLNSKIKELDLQDNVSKTLITTRKGRSSKKSVAYDKYLEKQEKYSKQAEGAGERKELFKELDYARKNKSPGSLGNRMIRGVATKQKLQETEYSGSYPSGFARQMVKSRAETKKRELASLKVERNKEKAEQHAKDLEEGKVKYKTKRRVIDKKPNGQIDISYEDAEVSNKKPKQYTDEENNELKRDVITNELAKILGGIEHVRKDVSIQLFKDYMTAAFASNKAAGKNDWKAIQETLEKTLNRYRGDKGALGITDGTKKGVFEGHAEAVAAIEEMLDYIKEVAEQSEQQGEISAESARQLKEIAKISEKDANKYVDELLGKGQQNKESSTVELNSQIAKEIAARKAADEKTFAELRKSTDVTTRQANIDKIENVREAVSDSNTEKTNKENKDINRDTAKAVESMDSKSEELINLVRNILQQLQLITTKQKEPPKQEEQEKIETSDEIKEQDKTTKAEQPDYSFEMKAVYSEIENAFEPMKNALAPLENSADASVETPKKTPKSEFDKTSGKPAEGEEKEIGVDKSIIYASPFRQGFLKKIEGAFESLTGATRQYEKVLRANAEDQDKLAAERIKTYGLNNGRNPNDTGDIAGMRRILQLYRTNKDSIEQNPELMQKIQLTKGREVDTTEITKALNEALSGKRMEKAQMGGGLLKNAFGFMTGGLGYAFMPSLEKSRAQAEGLNQMLGNINDALQSVLINIQTKETELSGMVDSGQAEFDKNGYLKPGSSSAAYKTLADLEEEKLVLDSIKADLLANDEIIKKTGGRFPQMVKYLNFTSPVLKDNNGILRNINSGLDKNGKALKFQNRLAEILNYTYQLMSRHIGQMIKDWITMASPMNLIKKAFSDFGSYDVKWQRTMNVIKINFQRLIKPAMEWIAQKLVNIIGFFNIISMKIQEAFGQIPVDLFDQAGANSEKIRRELEEAANVTAGFDELNDIGSDNSAVNDLLGDIYKPQLSQEWIDMATKLGETLGKFFKGDLGFGEVCKVILELLGKLLASIGKAIWGWFKETALGKWITEHWKGLLATLLTLFLGWRLLKIFGPTLLSTIGGAFETLLSKVGGWLGTGLSFLSGKLAGLFTGSGFLAQLGAGFNSVFKGGGLIGLVKGGALTFGSALGAIIGGALIAVVGGLIGDGIHDVARDSMESNNMYDIGLMENGGKESDKKGRGVLNTVGVIGGDTLKFGSIGAGIGGIFGGPLGMLIGGGIGAAIGAVAGTIETVLSPSIDAATISARNMNNELQKIEYYEGKVQGASTQVNEFTELVNLSNDALQNQTDKVYSLGEKYGVSKTTLDGLVQSIKDGNYNTEMAAGLNSELAGALEQLDWHYTNNEGLTNKLTEAKKKLQKAEMDLTIAQDIEAGNFELAAARVEVAYASEVYTADEATKKMTQIIKKGSAEQRSEILRDMSPELRKNWDKYYTTDQQGMREITALYDQLSEEERKAFLQDFNPELRKKMEERNKIIQQKIQEANGFLRMLDWNKDGKIFGVSYIGNVPMAATGTNYVASDGLAYIHEGEAIIPKKYNPALGQSTMTAEEQAYMSQMISTMRSLDNTMKQGINVNGQFVQRGSDLVAVVNKTKAQTGADLLSNVSYAR